MFPPAVPSVARFAPLGDMALRFDGQQSVATAALPADLIPPGPPGGSPFSLTFWALVPQPAPDVNPPPAEQVVADLRGPSGPLVTWNIGADGFLRAVLPASPPEVPGVSLVPQAGAWVFTATVYTPPDDTHAHGQVQLTVADGGPTPSTVSADLIVTPNPVHEDRTLTLGQPGTGAATGRALLGSVTRVRLWNAALTPDQITAEMYDYPLGFQAPFPSALRGDWRMAEGYGDTAFDTSQPAPDVLPVRYAPPPGNHLRLGTGQPGTEPVWVVADLTTLVHKTNTTALMPG